VFHVFATKYPATAGYFVFRRFLKKVGGKKGLVVGGKKVGGENSRTFLLGNILEKNSNSIFIVDHQSPTKQTTSHFYRDKKIYFSTFYGKGD